MTGGPLLQHPGDEQGHGPVDGDGEDEQEADDRVLPDGADPERREGAADRGEQQRAQGGAVDAAGTTGEGDASDDDGADDGQLESGAGAAVDVAEPRQVEDPGQAGQRSCQQVDLQDAAAHRDAGEPGGLGAGPERVELPPGAVAAQEQPHDHQDEQGDDRQPRNRPDAL